MCGITLSIYPVPAPQSPQSHAHKHILAIHDSLAQSNAHRGPDTSDTFTLVVDVDGGQVELRLTSSVLGLRGELTGQPVRGDRGVLAWNGQVSLSSHSGQKGCDRTVRDGIGGDLGQKALGQQDGLNVGEGSYA